jgi:hypothetical protein
MKFTHGIAYRIFHTVPAPRFLTGWQNSAALLTPRLQNEVPWVDLTSLKLFPSSYLAILFTEMLVITIFNRNTAFGWFTSCQVDCSEINTRAGRKQEVSRPIFTTSHGTPFHDLNLVLAGLL